MIKLIFAFAATFVVGAIGLLVGDGVPSTVEAMTLCVALMIFYGQEDSEHED